MPTFNATVIHNAVVKVKDDVDPVEFIKNGNEFLAEPKNADGCIIAMHLKEVNILGGKKSEIKIDNDKSELSDTTDRYMHFSFRGYLFCADVVEKTVTSTGKAKPEEMIGPKENGLWPLDVETSN